jgi:hypothetical protein
VCQFPRLYPIQPAIFKIINKKVLVGTIHKTLIHPVLLYGIGSETWVLTSTVENQLLILERKVLRTICGPKIENGVYRRRYNYSRIRSRERVWQPECSKCHEDKQIALRWSHDQKTRRPTTKNFIQSQPNGRKNQGRPKSRWADGENSDSLALRVRDWPHCAQDRQSWKDLLEQALTKYWL